MANGAMDFYQRSTQKLTPGYQNEREGKQLQRQREQMLFDVQIAQIKEEREEKTRKDVVGQRYDMMAKVRDIRDTYNETQDKDFLKGAIDEFKKSGDGEGYQLLQQVMTGEDSTNVAFDKAYREIRNKAITDGHIQKSDVKHVRAFMDDGSVRRVLEDRSDIAKVMTDTERMAENAGYEPGTDDFKRWVDAKNSGRFAKVFKVDDMVVEVDQLDPSKKSKVLYKGKAVPEVLELKERVKLERSWHNDFKKHSGSFIKRRDAFSTIVSSLSGTGASDLSLVFAYMKILDPGSTVREGEFATAAGARGALQRAEEEGSAVPSFLYQIIQKSATGAILTPAQRKDFARSAYNIYEKSVGTQTKREEEYARIADLQGLDKEVIIGKGLVDYFGYEKQDAPYPEGAVEMLRKQPGLAAQFKAKYGGLPLNFEENTDGGQ